MNARRVISYALHLLGVVAAMSFPCGDVMAAKPIAPSPNIVFMMADDKYEYSEPNAQKHRESSRKEPFLRRFQIAGNRGKLGRITGN